MSEQVPEQLTNSNPKVALPELKMFGLIRQLPTEENPWNECLDWFEYAVPPRSMTPNTEGACMLHYSCLCRGYVGHHELNADGTLTLLQYEYPTFDKTPSELGIVNLAIEGDFWLIMKEFSQSSATTFIPFLDGQIVADQSEWMTLHWPLG